MKRRRHRRHTFEAPIGVKAAHCPALQAKSRDLSKGGICIELPGEVSRGDRFWFNLSAEHGEHTLEAEVCWVGHEGGSTRAGLRWLNLSSHQDGFLGRFLTHLPENLRAA